MGDKRGGYLGPVPEARLTIWACPGPSGLATILVLRSCQISLHVEFPGHMAVSILYPGSSLFVGGVPCKLFGFGAGFGATGPVPEAWEWPCDPFGWILRTWRPFWTHFGAFLMI